ncbi:MAG: thiamine-phosphate kinase [Pelagibacterales bacterium]|nr:thiamine-phosphate kinase [Pelagibacterales bacterium]PPR15259.1 MAG: Thiamine-monophosphate kinase [Alphaproteobacteria bacterium MarineAlpha9_Bin3]|tara:strand:+ start:10562 stop:11509 length:948 start_codon:yes stop_codon:yes gene_type:complete
MENEFEFIKNKLRPLTFSKKEARGLSDDCAFFEKIKDLVVSVDSSIEGVHVPEGTDIDIQARRAVLRSISDLATFGSTPICVFTAMSLPSTFKQQDFDQIAEGYRKALVEYDIFLAGGDITSHEGLPIFSVTAFGANANKELGRNKTKPGDLIVVSGSIGDSFLGLEILKNNLKVSSLEEENLIKKFLIPEPKIELGKDIKSFANSIIDISDGLLSELNHLCENSGVGSEVYIRDIPISSTAKNYIASNLYNYKDLLSGGDDYELLYTIDPKDKALIDDNSFIIGKINSDKKIILYSEEGKSIDIKNEIIGYKHF